MSGFDFETFQAGLEEQRAKQEARMAAELAAQQKTAVIKDKNTRLQQEHDKSLGFLRKQVAESQSKANHARQLADSQNPLDTLRLIGLQAMDPAGYTRETRQARLSEDIQRANVLAHTYGVSQAALEAELLSSSNELDRAKLVESIGMERLKRIQVESELLGKNLLASHAFQEGAIESFDEKQLGAALQQAAANGGKVNIAGVEVESRFIEDRQNALANRRVSLKSQAAIRQIEEDKADNVEHDLAVTADTRAQEKRVIENRPHTNAWEDYQRQIQTETMANSDHDKRVRAANRAWEANAADNMPKTIASENAKLGLEQQKLIHDLQKQEIDTMSAEELMRIRQNNYKGADNETHYDPLAIDQAFARREQVRTDFVAQEMRRLATQNFDTDTLATEAARLAELEKRYPPNSPLYRAAQDYKAALGFATYGAGADKDPGLRQATWAAWKASQEAFDKQIVKQAVADSNGDKNLEDLKTAFYRGDPIPTEAIYNAVSTRIEKNKSLADVFPQEVATAVKSKYTELFQERIKTAGGMLGAAPSATDRKIVQEQAILDAVQFGIETQLRGRTEEIIGKQVLDQTHPLYQKWSPNDIIIHTKRADDAAASEWRNAHQLTPEDETNIRAGKAIGAGPDGQARDSKTLMDELRQRENTAFMLMLEQEEEGLGRQVADWWRDKSPAFLQREQQTRSTAAATDFKQAATYALGGEIEKQTFDTYSMNLSMAEESVKEEFAQRNADFLTFGSNPENMQVILLHNDKNLSEPEKALVFKEVVNPLIQAAKERKLNFRDTNLFVERGIASFESKNPEVKSLMKTLRRDRSQILERINSVSTVGRWLIGLGHFGTLGLATGRGTIADMPAPAKLEWYAQAKREAAQGVTTASGRK